jgi:hypothetical protein
MQGCKYKNALVVLAVILAVTFAGIGLFSSIAFAKNQEIGPNEVKGKVLATRSHGFGRGTIEVKSYQTAKIYTFYVGNRTAYYPNRYPYVGETVRVHYINDRGYLKATQVEIITP